MAYTLKLKRHPMIAKVVKGISALAHIPLWFMLYVLLLFVSEAYLAPWDMSVMPSPPLGSLPRIINDFFAVEGAHFVGYLGVGFNMAVLGYYALRNRLTLERLNRSLALNILFVLALIGMPLITHPVNAMLFPGVEAWRDVGYHRSMIGLVLMGLASSAYVWQQLRGSTQKQKRALYNERPQQDALHTQHDLALETQPETPDDVWLNTAIEQHHQQAE